MGVFFLLFSPKKIFVKGLKFKEVHCFLKRKEIPIPCKIKIANQNLWRYHISASSQSPTLDFLPEPGLLTATYRVHPRVHPASGGAGGGGGVASEASGGNLVLQGAGVSS